jgi:hypothetical protein
MFINTYCSRLFVNFFKTWLRQTLYFYRFSFSCVGGQLYLEHIYSWLTIYIEFYNYNGLEITQLRQLSSTVENRLTPPPPPESIE